MMDLSALRLPRRGVLALAVAAALTRSLPARAQSTAGCEVGIVNGLLSIGGADCGILSPPGLQGANVALPGHMVDATDASDATSTTSTETPQQIRQERLQRRREHRRRQRGNTRDRREDKQQRQGDRRRTEAEALTTCEDFRDQKEAIEWMKEFGDEAALDPNNNGLACETLRAVTCSQFGSRNEVESWHVRHGLDSDPYKLKVGADWCPNLKVTVNG